MLRSRSLLLFATGAAFLGASLALGPGQGLLATTLRDFQQPGTQAGTPVSLLQEAAACAACHGNYDDTVEPYARWAGSLMAQSSRDPIFHAALAIAEQDADFAGDLCWRCHAPNGWIAGRAFPTDGSALDPNESDLDGVSCAFCHRLVDPVPDADNPPEDAGILASLLLPPGEEPHTGQYVVDPEDRRRGPYDLGPSFGFHPWLESPYHRDALLCGTCHDVSNPVYLRQPDGSYALDDLNAPHPTGEKRDEFPIERTYTEWALSDYALGPVETGGRFGGNKSTVGSCQDCHMPDASGSACLPGQGEIRDDLPLHDFNGANSWVLRAVRDLYPDWQTGLTDSIVDDAIARNEKMLRDAAELSTFTRGGALVARVVNHGGHKLPTGYGEGRRMWLNVRFLDAAGNLLEERGAYDGASATLTQDTRVWEILHGLDDAAAQATGLPAGPSFHFVLNNTTEHDNRIPPRGYHAGDFAAGGAGVVGASYPDEHYWDEAEFTVPAGTATAEVRLYHQTTSREYVEFLRDENTTNAAGQVAYDQWLKHGKSAPVEMGSVTLDLAAPGCPTPIPFGPAKESTFGVPVLAWSGAPSVQGGAFALEVTGGAPGAWARAFWSEDARRTRLVGGGFRFLVEPQPGPAVQLDGAGAASIPIPVTGALVGEQRYFQVFFRDFQATQRIGATNGLYVEFCD